MTYSNLSGRTFSVLLASLAVMVGCVKPQSRPNDPNNTDASKMSETKDASFYNEEVTGGAVTSKNVDGFSIPTAKLYTFKTCVKDKRTRDTIKGHKFIVHGGEKAVDVRSDASGCVNWSETVPFNFMSDAKFLPLERFIEADGMHKGTRRIRVAINPWNHDGSEAVRDIEIRPLPDDQLASKEEVAKILKGETKSGEIAERFLWIDDLRANATHNPNGDAKSVDFSISMGPKILLKNVRGETAPFVVNDGIFNAQFWIVAKTESQQCIVIAKSGEIKDLKMVGGRLRDEVPMRLRYRNTYGQLELVGKVAAQGASNSLLPFEGVWMMGDHQSLLGMKFAEQRAPTYSNGACGFSAQKYLDSCVDVSDGSAQDAKAVGLLSGVSGSAPVATALSLPTAATKNEKNEKTVPADLLSAGCISSKEIPRLFPGDSVAQTLAAGDDFLSCENRNLPSGISRVEQFEFSHVDVRPEPIINPLETETTTERTIKFLVVTQVTNPLAGGALIRDIEFEVEKSDGTTEKVRTNHQGNLIFTDKIHHVYYQPERYMIKVVRIKHASGFSRRLGIVLNPWDNEGFTFARDIRRLTKQTVAQVN
ncbi:MAG: hypothetical protein JNJ49_01155, partial [Bdellovibrionaceae bacterium]|nr:hypothetical protein [Pseudobdellovibrionaceae bacterium]